jgi:hypothetical protein
MVVDTYNTEDTCLYATEHMGGVEVDLHACHWLKESCQYHASSDLYILGQGHQKEHP